MDEQQLQQLLQQIMQWLQEGQEPNAIVDELVKQEIPEDVATQLVDAAIQQLEGGGAEGQAPAGSENPPEEAPLSPGGDPSTAPDAMDPNQLIDQVLQQVGPNVMLAILEAYDSLGAQGQEAKKQQMAQMSNDSEAQQGTAEAAQPQPQGGVGQEQALFG